MKVFASLTMALVTVAVFAFSGCSKVATKGEDSIYNAAASGDLAQITSATQNGFDINTPDENGMTLLHHAAKAGKKDVVEMLTGDYNANTSLQDKSGKTAFDLAVESGDQGTIQALQENQ
jgi:ankyrin repeat protein